MISNLWNLYHEEIPDYLKEGMLCPSFMRLQHVGMNCGMNYTSFPFYGAMEPYSRYEHSVGAALIVHHFTGDPKQALSGLFHDIATPAFAHVVDFLNNDHVNQESTESGTGEVIDHDPQIAALLHRLHLESSDVKDYHMYPIADNDSPKLSADRLEYTLGCLWHYHICQAEELRMYYENLVPGINESGETELCFENAEIAESFACTALKCSYIYTTNEDRYGMQALAILLKKAIDRRIISYEDLMKDEPYIIRCLTESDLAHAWMKFTMLNRIKVSTFPEQGGIQISAKKRYIDPYIKNKGRLSTFSERFRSERDQFLAQDFHVYIREEEQ